MSASAEIVMRLGIIVFSLAAAALVVAGMFAQHRERTERRITERDNGHRHHTDWSDD